MIEWLKPPTARGGEPWVCTISKEQVARHAYDAALEAAKAGIVAEFKAKVAAVATLPEM